jgi:hypothetical protein
MQHALSSALLSFSFGFLSCSSQTRLPSLGAVKPEQLCSEIARCDVRGDEAVSTLTGRNTTPIHLADGQGPESYLGKVAPKRKANSVLKTCGGDVTRDDWLETGPTARTVELGDQGKQQLRASLKAHLAQQILEHPQVLEGQTAGIDALVDAASQGLGLQKVGLLSQTYWLKDSAFERRVGQCGEEEYKDIIYSLTMLRLSDLTQKELETKLLANLEAKLPFVDPSAREADAGRNDESAAAVEPAAAPAAQEGDAGVPLDPVAAHKALLRELGYGAVKALSSELRTIAALGFDEP